MKNAFLVLAIFGLLIATALADSVDEAEAKRKGISVEAVEVERLKARVAALEAEVKSLQAKIAATQPTPAMTLPAKTPSLIIAQNNKPPATQTAQTLPGQRPVDIEKTVHVNGYTRKDGTYVAPYDRRAPSKK
jgi:hypothetical protein